jgi:hypothetical protein
LARDKAKFERLFAARKEAYTFARFRVETLSKEIAEVAQEIEQILQGSGDRA